MSTTAKETLPRLELICFGAPTALVDGSPAEPEVRWRRHLALLIYLALSPNRSRSREHVLGLLWPEKEEEKARHSLNEALRRLRRCLGENRLVSHGDSLTLHSNALDVDVERFQQLVESDESRAIEILKGDFLEGFTVDDAPGFEDWASGQRGRFRTIGSALLVGLGERALTGNRFLDAQDAARRVLELNSTAEPAASLLMRTAALAGDATGALAAYQTFCETVSEEIGESPSRELQELAERIRSQRWRRISSPLVDHEPPLSGRPTACRTAFAVVDRSLGGETAALCIDGDPGMGKTRLLTECVGRLALSGGVTAVARPLESDHDAPWSTLRLLMRCGLADAPGVAGTDPHSLSVLASLIPELADRHQPTEPRDSAQVASALAAYCQAVSEEQPVGLAIDDAHLADGMTLGVLHALVRQLERAPVLVITAATYGEHVPAELLRFRSDVGRGVPGASVRLPELTEQEMRELVAACAPWCSSPEHLDRLVRRISFEAGGSPLLTVTLLGNLDHAPTLKDELMTWPPPNATYESTLPFTIPDLTRMVILARVTLLDEETRAVLRAASIGGAALDPPVIADLCELPSERIERALDRLEQHRFVTYDGTRYAFTAQIVAKVVRSDCLTRGQRQRLRRAAAERLVDREDLESRVLRAELLARIEPGEGACQEAVAVARQALDSGSYRTARRALAAAELATESELGSSRVEVQSLRAQLEEYRIANKE